MMPSHPQHPSQLTVAEMPADCNNAPRKIVLRDFLISLYDLDLQGVLDRLHDDVEWHTIGESRLAGHDGAAAWLAEQPAGDQLTVHTVITHGTDCGADGVISYTDGRRHAFSHVVIFAGHSKSAKIKAIRSYLVDLQEDADDGTGPLHR